MSRELWADETCHAHLDGDCYWAGCPQTRDGEPEAAGRHCPLDVLPEENDGLATKAQDVPSRERLGDT